MNKISLLFLSIGVIGAFLLATVFRSSPSAFADESLKSGHAQMSASWAEASEIPSDDELKKILTPLQYRVTRKEGTEPPFRNEYWDNKKAGIYVDIISGEPLFSSTDKYTSGTGWPSFTKPIFKDRIVEREDGKHWMVRVEVRSKGSDAHLGHVFTDGPPPTGLRYCINSAALRFIPAEDLKKNGYESLVSLFGGGSEALAGSK